VILIVMLRAFDPF